MALRRRRRMMVSAGEPIVSIKHRTSSDRIAGARLVVIGNPQSRRTALLQAALARLGWPEAYIVPYVDLLAGHMALPDVVQPGNVVRIESPGKDFAVERLLLARGAEAAQAESTYAAIPRPVAETLPFDKGRLLYPRQWYLRLCATLGMIEEQLSHCPPHRRMNDAGDIAVMFDKPLCHERMARQGIPVPPDLSPVRSYAELVDRMQRTGHHRVFVKLAHGSSAAGVVAYQCDGRRHHATTTVEMVRENGTCRLYNTRRLRVHQDRHTIAELIDALCRHRVHVERWLPKADVDGYTFDIRIVVIAGQARHTIIRKSQGPMTNLHLLNDRSGPEPVIARMGETNWQAARHTCERAAACFPRSLYAGVDLLVAPDYRHHAVLEINAFGDLLPNVLEGGNSGDGGLDTYATELLSLDGTTEAQ